MPKYTNAPLWRVSYTRKVTYAGHPSQTETGETIVAARSAEEAITQFKRSCPPGPQRITVAISDPEITAVVQETCDRGLRPVPKEGTVDRPLVYIDTWTGDR